MRELKYLACEVQTEKSFLQIVIAFNDPRWKFVAFSNNHKRYSFLLVLCHYTLGLVPSQGGNFSAMLHTCSFKVLRPFILGVLK